MNAMSFGQVVQAKFTAAMPSVDVAFVAGLPRSETFCCGVIARAFRVLRSLLAPTLFGMLSACASCPVHAAEPQLTAAQTARLAQAKQLTDRALKLNKQGKYRDAIEPTKQALAIRKEVLGLKHPDTAGSLNNLGTLLQSLGDYGAARSDYEQALAIRKEVLGLKHPDTATSLNNLGTLFSDQGDYGAARPYYEQSLAIRKEVLGLKHPDTARSLDNLGTLFSNQGVYGAARPYHEQALAIRKEVLGLKHPDTARSLNSLGYLLRSQGDYVAARPYYEQALAINKDVLGLKHPVTATSLDNLGTLLSNLGDYAAAEPCYEQALAIRREVLGLKHSDTASSLNNMGYLLHSQGDYVAARPYYEQALAIDKDVLGLKHPVTASLYGNLSLLCAQQHDWVEATEMLTQTRRAIREHIARVLPALDQKQQMQFVETRDRYPLFGALSLGLHAREHRPLAAASAEFLINGKAVIQESLAEGAQLAAASDNPEIKRLAEKLQTVRRELATLSQSAPKPAEAAAYRQKLDELDGQQTDLSAQVNQRLQRSDRAHWVTLDDVRRGIPRAAVLVDIARLQPYNFAAKGKDERFQAARYIAWLTPASGEVQVIDLGPADKIDAAAQDFREVFSACQSSDATKNPLALLAVRGSNAWRGRAG